MSKCKFCKTACGNEWCSAKTRTPVAVLISDIHYSLPTLALADAAMRQAIAKANELNIPLIVAGDLHDTKANIRAECVSALLITYSLAEVPTYTLVGNHDLINEKSEDNALEFLRNNTKLIRHPQYWKESYDIFLVPYQSTPQRIKSELDKMQDVTIIMHQGIEGSDQGHYIQDPTAIPQDWVKDFRVISGHYHRRQDIKTGRPQKGCVGVFSYIGNPYTLNYGEANDPPKGFQILMDDGTLEFVPTNLRKHVVLEMTMNDLSFTTTTPEINPDDLVWLKIKGPREELAKLDRETIVTLLDIRAKLKLDLIPNDSTPDVESLPKDLPQGELLDKLIDSIPSDTDDRKERLKSLWRKYENP